MPGTNISYKAIIKSLVPLKVQCPLPTIGLELYQPAGGTLQGKKVSSNCYVSIGKPTSRITRTRKWIPPFVDTEKNSFSMCAKVSYVQFCHSGCRHWSKTRGVAAASNHLSWATNFSISDNDFIRLITFSS